MDLGLAALVLFGSLFVLLVVGTPIGLAMAAAGALYLLGTLASWAPVASIMFSALDKAPVLAIPFFILAAEILSRGGAIGRLVAVIDAFIGHLPGGLAIVAIMATVIFSAMCGSSIATAAAIGVATLPELIRRGYQPRFSYGLIAMSGGLGILIPPSIPLIIYGLVTGESIGKLFEAGFVPGLVFALLLGAYVVARTWNMRETRRPRTTAAERRSALVGAIDILMLPVIILGSLYGGLFTPTEASAVAVVYAIAITWRRFSGLGDFMAVLANASVTSAAILFVLAGAAVFSYALTASGIPQLVVDWIRALDLSAIEFLLVVNVVLLVLGMFLEVISAMLITIPIFFPIIQHLGIDPIHFAIIMIVNMEIAAVTPPIGLNLFTLSAIARVPVGEVFRGTAPFIGIALVMLALVTYVPGLSLVFAR
ncbi:MAG: TRAP transporter large permease [Rhodospirillaceae bacterium]